jgi:hypothetical protein
VASTSHYIIRGVIVNLKYFDLAHLAMHLSKEEALTVWSNGIVSPAKMWVVSSNLARVKFHGLKEKKIQKKSKLKFSHRKL